MIRTLRDLFWEAAEPGRPRTLRKPAIYLLMATVVLILGLNWPIMATGVASIPPVWMAAFRMLGALAVVLTVVVASGRLRLPPRHDLPIIASLALFRLTGVVVIVFIALEMVPPGRSSVVVWTSSLWTVPIAAVFLGERMTGRRWVGLALGIVGVLVLFEPWYLDWTNADVAIGHLLLVIAAVGNAATAVHIRAHRWTISPLEAVPWQVASAAVILVTLGLLTGGLPEIAWTPQLVWVVLYQGVLATGVAFWAQVTVLQNLPAISTNVSLMAVPFIGVLSSALLLGEEITVSLAIGLILVIVGVTINLLADRSTPEEALSSDLV